ncbi:XRE family transcriptional regulator [Longicatena caecimuris]|uniref:XRE family transcriptional regulator n=1 Tax=Longicatena caecimuris TaxID=1796635 RepID=UPI003AB533E5
MNIKKERIIKSFTIKEMAEILHIYEEDYINIENNININDVDAYLCKRICDILGLDFNTL